MAIFIEDFPTAEERAVLKLVCENSLKAYIKIMHYYNTGAHFTFKPFHDEVIDNNNDLTIYHQANAWKNKTLYAGTYDVLPLQHLVFDEGKRVYPEYTLNEIREYSKEQKALLWDELFRLEYPHQYYVDLTKKLLDYKMKMLEANRK